VLRKVLILTAMVCGLALFPATAFADIEDIENEVEDAIALVNQQVNAQLAEIDQDGEVDVDAESEGGDGGDGGDAGTIEGDIEVECSPGSRSGGGNDGTDLADVGNCFNAPSTNLGDIDGGDGGDAECSPASRNDGGGQDGNECQSNENETDQDANAEANQSNECSPASRLDANGGAGLNGNACQESEGGDADTGDAEGGDAGTSGRCNDCTVEVGGGPGDDAGGEGGEAETGDAEGGESENNLEAENNAIVEGGENENETEQENELEQTAVGGDGGLANNGAFLGELFSRNHGGDATQTVLTSGNSADGGNGGPVNAEGEINNESEIEQESEQEQDIEVIFRRIRDSFNLTPLV
jgi:hypothetical protein